MAVLLLHTLHAAFPRTGAHHQSLSVAMAPLDAASLMSGSEKSGSCTLGLRLSSITFVFCLNSWIRSAVSSSICGGLGSAPGKRRA